MAIDIHSAKRIDILSANRRGTKVGSNLVFEFYLDTESDVDDLPLHGDWAANTSLAFVKSTGNVYILGINGWGAI